MISGSIFSMADLNESPFRLFGKFMFKGTIYECELIEENIQNGTTEVRLRGGDYMNVKTKDLYEFKHYDVSKEILPF